jgi:hypothetical protein
MRKCSAPNLASECTLQSADFIFEVLGLLTQCPAFVLWWSHGLDRVTNALYLVGKAVAHDGKVWRQSAIVVNQ